MEYGKIWFGEDSESEEEPKRDRTFFERVEHRKYRTPDGDTVKVKITEYEVKILYSNGAVEIISIEKLRVCPECLKEGLLPFTSSHVCPIHGIGTIPYDPDDFYAMEVAFNK
ncbi:MAG: hypothetical protein DRN26_01970 [Thermoplasmata archaeon]|nr:MAG: hypothetical protein DRN26_01970 [Thermoplasmata archaeon]